MFIADHVRGILGRLAAIYGLHKEKSVNEPIMVKVDVCAQMMSMGRTAIYELIQQGELPTVHIGRSVRIPTRAIHELVARLEAELMVA